MKILKIISLSLVVLVLALVTILYSRYGGGDKWEFQISKPLMEESKLEVIASLPFPPGNIAVNKDNRIFITIHPESKPEINKVVEIINGEFKPFPDSISQSNLYSHPQGIRIDSKNRVCTIDHGDNGIAQAKLVCVQIDTKMVEIDYTFPREVAPFLSYLQDLAIDSESRFYYIADVNFFGKKPALVIYDSLNNTSRRVLENHPSVVAENWRIQAYNGPMDRLGGLIVLKAGADSIAIDSKSEWLYYGPMNHRNLFRIPTKILSDFTLNEDAIETYVEKYSDKILSDGIILDKKDNIYLTDVEHQSIAMINKKREMVNLIQSEKFRWPDGLSIGSDGYMYIADSDIPNIALQSKEHIKSSAPFHLFRFTMIFDK